ncbi:hypothetical protein DNL40_02495 [Xylanimonas oleitrophica]|uniref:Holliday junction nuclease RuvC n=1 Tax=Xylanimonas oleitrophica TaxID=2607479 RepID=A0A2W5WVR3_9MICO|nr:crossover junction endodeoxyribonuclease RuvC [Xylanimonas oleitrophica]PZR55260.1 hypothetical protein DNL40_02495 [Xylanimonas oleitrophica]
MKVVGLDLSLTSTGVAVVWAAPRAGHLAQVDRIRTSPAGDTYPARWSRLRDIVDEAMAWVSDDTDLVVLEGLAYASKSPHATERAGLWWMLAHRLLVNDHRLAVVTPSARAKYATGSGAAGKDTVLAAVVRRYVDVDVTGNDEADALVLAAMGARALGRPIDELPKNHLDAMAKVAWPEGLAQPCPAGITTESKD